MDNDRHQLIFDYNQLAQDWQEPHYPCGDGPCFSRITNKQLYYSERRSLYNTIDIPYVFFKTPTKTQSSTSLANDEDQQFNWKFYSEETFVKGSAREYIDPQLIHISPIYRVNMNQFMDIEIFNYTNHIKTSLISLINGRQTNLSFNTLIDYLLDTYPNYEYIIKKIKPYNNSMSSHNSYYNSYTDYHHKLVEPEYYEQFKALEEMVFTEEKKRCLKRILEAYDNYSEYVLK
jgi:hypothetical protein